MGLPYSAYLHPGWETALFKGWTFDGFKLRISNANNGDFFDIVIGNVG